MSPLPLKKMIFGLSHRLRRDRERQEQLARERLARRKRRGKPEEEDELDEEVPDKGIKSCLS